MNKLILVLALVLVGCATTQPTRTVLNCQSDYIVGNGALFIGGSRVEDDITCETIQVQIELTVLSSSITKRNSFAKKGVLGITKRID